MTLSHRKLHP